MQAPNKFPINNVLVIVLNLLVLEPILKVLLSVGMLFPERLICPIETSK